MGDGEWRASVEMVGLIWRIYTIFVVGCIYLDERLLAWIFSLASVIWLTRMLSFVGLLGKCMVLLWIVCMIPIVWMKTCWMYVLCKRYSLRYDRC